MPAGPCPDPVVDEPFGARPAELRLSVIVVAWQAEHGLVDCIARLAEILPTDAEVLLTGNAVDLRSHAGPLAAAGLSGRVLQLAMNDGPSPARNAAAAVAGAPVLAFLDDDALIEPGWADALVGAVGPDGVQAVRGRVIANEHPTLTRLARAYDLGDAPKPALLNTEGNMAIRAQAFHDVGGFAAMFGHEGVELSSRVRGRFGDDAIWYAPGALIRHDYVSGFGHYLAKRFRHGRMMRRLTPADVRAAAAVRPALTARDRLLSPLRGLGGVAELAGVAWATLPRRR